MDTKRLESYRSSDGPLSDWHQVAEPTDALGTHLSDYDWGDVYRGDVYRPPSLPIEDGVTADSADTPSGEESVDVGYYDPQCNLRHVPSAICFNPSPEPQDHVIMIIHDHMILL